MYIQSSNNDTYMRKNKINKLTVLNSGLEFKSQTENTFLSINSNAYKTLTFMPNLVKNIKYIIENDVKGNLLAIEKPILTVSELQSLIASKMKLKRIKISVKPSIFVLLGRVWEAIFGIITKDPVITEQRVKKFFSSTSEYPEGSLKYKQYVNFEDALVNSIKK